MHSASPDYYLKWWSCAFQVLSVRAPATCIWYILVDCIPQRCRGRLHNGSPPPGPLCRRKCSYCVKSCKLFQRDLEIAHTNSSFSFAWISYVGQRFITARIRRMGECNIFSLCVNSHPWRGVPQPGPSPRWGWGGGYPNPSWWGVSPSFPMGVTPILPDGGVPLSGWGGTPSSWWGYFGQGPGQDGGIPLVGTGWGYPSTRQSS